MSVSCGAVCTRLGGCSCWRERRFLFLYLDVVDFERELLRFREFLESFLLSFDPCCFFLFCLFLCVFLGFIGFLVENVRGR